MGGEKTREENLRLKARLKELQDELQGTDEMHQGANKRASEYAKEIVELKRKVADLEEICGKLEDTLKRTSSRALGSGVNDMITQLENRKNLKTKAKKVLNMVRLGGGTGIGGMFGKGNGSEGGLLGALKTTGKKAAPEEEEEEEKAEKGEESGGINIEEATKPKASMEEEAARLKEKMDQEMREKQKEMEQAVDAKRLEMEKKLKVRRRLEPSGSKYFIPHSYIRNNLLNIASLLTSLIAGSA